MGMTYHELSVFGRLRKEQKLGPVGMFQRLVFTWKDEYSMFPTQTLHSPPPHITPSTNALFSPPRSRRQSQTLLPLLGHQPPQNDRHDALATYGGLLARRQPLRFTPVLLLSVLQVLELQED